MPMFDGRAMQAQIHEGLGLMDFSANHGTSRCGMTRDSHLWVAHGVVSDGRAMEPEIH